MHYYPPRSRQWRRLSNSTVSKRQSTSRVVPASRVRAFALLVLAAYALPTVAAYALVTAELVGSNLPAFQPPLIVAALLVTGLFPSAAAWLRTRGSDTFLRPAPPARRALIVTTFPEFRGVDIQLSPSADEIYVSRNELVLGMKHLHQIGPTRIGDEVFMKLAHEARHRAIRASRLVAWFRLIKSTYLPVGLFVYTNLLLNVAIIADGPNRIVIIACAVLYPYVSGLLRAVLDEATGAFEWRLEMDADDAALGRCRAEGRDGLERLLDLPRKPSFVRAQAHPPATLRSQTTPRHVARLVTGAALLAGWLAAVLPVGMLALFAFTETGDPDRYNALLAALSLLTLAAAAAPLLVAFLIGRGTLLAARPTAALGVVWARVYRTSMILGGLSLAVWALPMTLATVRESVAGNWNPIDLLSSPMLLASCAALLSASRWGAPTRLIILAAVVDAGRIFLLTWLLLATAVLPFFDDLAALGAAVRDNPVVVGAEMGRLWAEQPSRLVFAALFSFGVSLAAASLTIMVRRALLRYRPQGAAA